MPDWTSYFSLIKIWVKKITKEASKRETDSDYITFNIKTNQLNAHINSRKKHEVNVQTVEFIYNISYR